MNDPTSAVILEDRLIAFLDVLGFGALLATRDLGDLHRDYASFVDIAKNQTFYGVAGDEEKRTNFAHAQIVSDSVILVSNEIGDVYNVNNFVGAVSFLLEAGLVSRFPLRGAITRGDFLLDEERQIFLSRAFAEAVKYEGQQQWTGCAILDPAKDVILDAAFGKTALTEGVVPQKNLPVVKYPIPMKDGQSDDRWCVNFTFFLGRQDIENGIDYLISPKKENFRSYLERLDQLPYQEQILPPEYLPAKGCRTMTTRSGMRMGFVDKDGNPCKPGVNRIGWVAVGRWRE